MKFNRLKKPDAAPDAAETARIRAAVSVESGGLAVSAAAELGDGGGRQEDIYADDAPFKARFPGAGSGDGGGRQEDIYRDTPGKQVDIYADDAPFKARFPGSGDGAGKQEDIYGDAPRKTEISGGGDGSGQAEHIDW